MIHLARLAILAAMICLLGAACSSSSGGALAPCGDTMCDPAAEICVLHGPLESGDGVESYGCDPLPAACGGEPSCACVSCGGEQKISCSTTSPLLSLECRS